MWQVAHAEVIDDEQGDSGEVGEVVLPRAADSDLGNLLDESVRLAIDDAIACWMVARPMAWAR